MPTPIIADYNQQRAAFEALLQPNPSQRILFFRGQGGSGKTTLLNACLQIARERDVMPCIPIQLRGTAVSVAEIFHRVVDCLDWERLPRFMDQVDTLQGPLRVQIDHNRQIGIGNRIDVALHAETPADRQGRRAALTQAWFDDLRALDSPLLVALDTYEAATTEVQEWISGPFLARAAQAHRLRILLAGREVPDLTNIEWGHCCTNHELLGVPESKHWWPVVEAMKRQIDVPDPKSWLAGVCHAFQGRPKEIMQIIQDLPIQGQGA